MDMDLDILRELMIKDLASTPTEGLYSASGLGWSLALGSTIAQSIVTPLARSVIIGGLSGVHQFVRIGHHAMIGGMSGVEGDVIPFGLVMGERAHLSGLNVVGLKRRGFSRHDIQSLRTAYRLLFAQEGTMAERLADVAGLYADSRPVMDLVEFIKVDSARAIVQPRGTREG